MVPTHGIDCRTVTFKTKCRECDSIIYIFMCNHGSCVLFDDLGPPWPFHDCDVPWTRGLTRTHHEDGSISVPWRNGITFIRPSTDFSVEPSSLDRALKRTAKNYVDPIRRVDPPRSGVRQLVGMLREMSRNADPMKAFDLPNTTMARAMLGKAWQEPVGRITVHVDDGVNDYLESYTAWVPARFIRSTRISTGIPVAVRLVSVALPYEDVAWFCEEFDPLV